MIHVTERGVFQCVGEEEHERAGVSTMGTCLREAESCEHGLLSSAGETKPQNTPPCAEMPRVPQAVQTSLP